VHGTRPAAQARYLRTVKVTGPARRSKRAGSRTHEAPRSYASAPEAPWGRPGRGGMRHMPRAQDDNKFRQGGGLMMYVGLSQATWPR
jgi:hypothetical protein